MQSQYAVLTESGARFLLDSGVRLVGVDSLSVERLEGDGKVHRILLQGGAVILEGLNLAAVGAGEYELICLPLKILGGDGAPARVILRRSGSGEQGEGPDLHSSRWPLS
jgi:arylformamidase